LKASLFKQSIALVTNIKVTEQHVNPKNKNEHKKVLDKYRVKMMLKREKQGTLHCSQACYH